MFPDQYIPVQLTTKKKTLMRQLVPQRYPVDKSLSFFSLIMALLWMVHELSCLNSPPRQLIIMRKCPATLRDGTLQLFSLILIN